VSRSWEGESDDPLDWGRYKAATRSTLRGRRGQAFLRELIAALDALHRPELSAGALGNRRTGCVCALGAIALAQGASFDDLARDNGDWGPGDAADWYNISPTLANEIISANDDWGDGNSAKVRQSRWRHVRT
jgi:hypothetical protein